MLGFTGSSSKATKQQKATPRKTAQQTIPYKFVYGGDSEPDGIIETSAGVLTRTYRIADVSYTDVGDEKQDSLLKMYESMLNSFDHNNSYEITINKSREDMTLFEKEVLMPLQYDDEYYDTLREENNEMMRTNLAEGTNNTKTDIYLTVAVEAEDLSDAKKKFLTSEKTINTSLTKINGKALKPVSLTERLELLYNIYNNGHEEDFSRERIIKGKKVKALDFDNMMKMKYSTKDIIAPPSFQFEKNYMMLGDRYARAMYLKNIPTWLSSVLINTIAEVPAQMVVSMHFQPIEQQKAVDFAQAQYTNIGGDVVKAQQNLTKNGGSPDLIPPKLKTAYDDSTELLDSLTNRNMTLLHTTVVCLVFADTLEDLNTFTTMIKNRAKTLVCQMETLTTQQEQGLNAVLPLCVNNLYVHKVFTSNTASAIQPFSEEKFNHKGGLSYGYNTNSREIIRINKQILPNQNSVILGVPGGGKSVTAKLEMEQIFLNRPNSQIIVIDPEGEYRGICAKFKGQVVTVAPGSTSHINPLDLDMTPDEDGERSPLSEQISYITSLCEIMCNSAGFSGEYKGIIDNALTQLYTPYIEELKKRGIYIDRDICPTLKDFHQLLKNSNDPSARRLAKEIEVYCTGHSDMFAYKTNIDPDSKMIVYDIFSLGQNMLPLGMSVCMNAIWNKMISNKGKGISTFLYVDEFYLMLRNIGTAQYLQMIWKRARKWMGVPTGLTQNVGDLIKNEYGQAIILTSSMIVMLKQSAFDCAQLASPQLCNLSPDQMEYVIHAGVGQGLIKIGDSVVPYTNRVPTSSELYRLISTKSAEAEKATASLEKAV